MIDREREIRNFEEHELDNKVKVPTPYHPFRNASNSYLEGQLPNN
jgi:hypothetical protein